MKLKLGNHSMSRGLLAISDKPFNDKTAFHYVPLLSSLKSILRDKNVLDQVLTTNLRIRNDGYFEDYCDGQLFQSNALFCNHPTALQIVAYYDEIEICNALGSYVKKHKLGVVFFVLGNLHPKFRSRLQAINLVLLATVPIIEKHGIDVILRPFMNDLNTLATAGIDINVDGVSRNFKGGLLVFLGDTLALHTIAGFKRSLSRSFRICRTCMATSDKASTDFNSINFEPRSESTHRQHCMYLNGPLQDHYSTVYGVTHKSILLDVSNYDMFHGGLPHDIMHDLFEGVVQYEIKLLLNHLVSSNLMILDDFNRHLLNFDYGYSEIADKPTPITKRNLTSNDKELRQNASQCMLLSRILPFLIATYFAEDDLHWQCYIALLKIINICLSPVVNVDKCASLKVLIEEHHMLFKMVNPSCTITPKMHFMCHYPELILQVGPLVRSWTMRHEAKLHFFKQAAHMGNFKNVTLTLANRQQRWSCYQRSSGSIVDTPVEYGPALEPGLLKAESQSLVQMLFAIFIMTYIWKHWFPSRSG